MGLYIFMLAVFLKLAIVRTYKITNQKQTFLYMYKETKLERGARKKNKCNDQLIISITTLDGHLI